MKETPQRLRSYAPPTRDKIFIWSAVIAGCGIMALLGRHAAITRFGTDEFTGNVLFAVFFVLTIGLYFGFQSAVEDVFNRLSTLFRRREVMAIAETANGEKMHVSVEEWSLRGKSSVTDAYLGGVAGYRCPAGAHRRDAVKGCQWLVHRYPLTASRRQH